MNTTPPVGLRLIQADGFYSTQYRQPGWLPDLPAATPAYAQTNPQDILSVGVRVLVMDKRTSGVLVCTHPEHPELYTIGLYCGVAPGTGDLMGAVKSEAQALLTQGLGIAATGLVNLYPKAQESAALTPPYRLVYPRKIGASGAPVPQDVQQRLEVVTVLRTHKANIETYSPHLCHGADWKSVSWLRSVAEGGCKQKLDVWSQYIIDNNLITSITTSQAPAIEVKF